jgi:succinate-semialdehyde dehydrogenase/glutarate-semialdehyde dehydrogenase
VLIEVASTVTILKTEIFGPIALIVSFEDEQEAIAIANDTQYGLASNAYTKDLSRAMRIVDSLEAGMTGMNTCLADSGPEGIEGLQETKYVLFPAA